MAFQGVVCYGFNTDKSIKDLLDLSVTCKHHETICYELELKNKYYQTKIHLFDFSTLVDVDDDKRSTILKECHAVILHGSDISDTLLDEKVNFLDEVAGEPRILVCDHDDSLRAWSLKNGFDLLDVSDEDVESQMIDSLSAYKWPYRLDKDDEEQKQLDEETIRKLMDFDYLLNRVKTCRDEPDDKKIHEIGQLLSGLLGDDIDNFLADDHDDHGSDDDDDDDVGEEDGKRQEESTEHQNEKLTSKETAD